MSQYCFLITSAIIPKFGVFEPQKRFEQTITTINSIRGKIPDARIVLLECSGQALSEDIKKHLLQSVNLYADFSKDQNVTHFYKTIENHDIMKNLTEMVCFVKFLNLAKENKVKVFEGVDRVFKISGRYYLTDNFDITKYDDTVKGKYVFKRKMTSQFPIGVTGGVNRQYMSRLWSFDPILLNETIATFTTMINNFIDRVNNKGYIDIEHSFYKFMDPQKVIEFEKTGVAGQFGATGCTVED